MIRISIFGAVMLSASILQVATAQDLIAPPQNNTAIAFETIAQQAPVQHVNHQYAPGCRTCQTGAANGGYVVGAQGGVNGGVYPQLNAPLYPAPVQSVQPWSGGSIITNQALAPHEMLYPHKYHSMYGPFYYRVKGCWIWTPFGMRQHEQWKLQGTEVKVNYRSTYAPFSGFHPKH